MASSFHGRHHSHEMFEPWFDEDPLPRYRSLKQCGSGPFVFLKELVNQ